LASLLDFLPLFRETALTIRGRIDADANAGVDPTSDDYIDTTEGGFYWDLTQVVVLEVERLMDMLATEVPAAAFPQYAWGDYLDDHGETIGVARKNAAKASGEATFTGTDDTIIPVGTRVGNPQTAPDEDPVEFVTMVGAIISGGVVTVGIEADAPGSRFNVAIGTITELLNAPAGVTSVTNTAATSGGTDVEPDDVYRDRILLELSSPQGAGNAADYERWALVYAGIGFCTVEPLWDGPGTVRLMITDPANVPVSGSVTSGLKTQLDPASATSQLDGAVTLPEATITVDSTAGFRAATGPSPQKIFVGDQPVTYEGSTATTFTDCTGGTGVIADNTAVTQSGEGLGLAPIGANVWVATPSVLTITVDADVRYDTGYSDGSVVGTVNVAPEIEAAITSYIKKLGPGGDVIHTKVVAAIVDVQGVEDVSLATVLLDGAASNISVDGDRVPTAGTITLT